MKWIKTNSIRCLKCNSVISSVHVHHYQECPCGSVAVDGGFSYLRRIGDVDNYEELSELYDLDNQFELVREEFKWTSSYDKKGNILEEIKQDKLKDLDTEHIKNILKLRLNDVIMYTLSKELEFRKDKIND